MAKAGGRALRFAVGLAFTVGVSQALMPAALAAVTNVPNDTASFNGVVRAVVYSGGVVYVGGDFTAAIQNGQSITRNHVAAIDESTGTVLPWNPNANGDVHALAVNGSAVYLGGTFGRVGGAVHSNIASVSPGGTGAVNAQFTARATSGHVNALTVSGTSVYAGGTFRVANGQSKSYLAAFDSQTGALRTGFNAVPNNTVRSLDAANGQVYAGGEFSTMNGLWRGRYLASLDPATGAVPTGWTSPVGYRIMGIAATSTNVYAAGDGAGGHLVATNLNGAAQWVVTADGGFQAVTLLGSTIYAGGHFGNVCSTSRTGSHGACLDGQSRRAKLAAFNLSGTLQAWAPNANSALGVHSMDSDPATGRIAVGGEFTKFNFGKISQPYFAQFG
jgi:hypothetical protein